MSSSRLWPLFLLSSPGLLGFPLVLLTEIIILNLKKKIAKLFKGNLGKLEHQKQPEKDRLDRRSNKVYLLVSLLRSPVSSLRPDWTPTLVPVPVVLPASFVSLGTLMRGLSRVTVR